MKEKFTKKIFALFVISIFAFSVFALSVPTLTSPVVDNAGIVDSQTETELNRTLKNLSDTTGIQIAVLTIPTLDGESLEGYAMQVAKQWQLGNREKDTGALLLVSMQEHAVRIEVGYGLESSLTDAKCGLIIRNIIAPNFRNGNYSQGIFQGVQNIIGIVTQDESLVSKQVAEDESKASFGSIIYFIIFIIVMVILLSTKTGRQILFYSLLFGGGRGRNGGSGRGSSSHGSFGGGGFSGGGGHFGGGGASGHW